MLIVLATVLYGLSINIVNHKLSNVDPYLLSGITFLIMGIPALLFLFNNHTFYKFQMGETLSIYAIMTLALLCSFVGTILYYWLILNSSNVFASMYGYLVPIGAIILGFMDGENITIIQILCIFVILFGIFLANNVKIENKTT